MHFRLLFLLSLILIQSVTAFSQSSLNAGKSKTPAEDKVTIQRPDPLQLSHEIAVIFFAFEESKTKVWALSQLGDLLWDRDENYARQFLQKALDACALHDGLKAAEREKLVARRKTLISIVSKYDPAWAERLIEEDEGLTDSERQEANVSTAYKLLDISTEKSGSFIERARKSGLPEDLPFYLQALRAKDPAAANALFVSALSQLARQPFVSVETILAYGTFVYMAPGKGPYTISAIGIGDSMVYNLLVDRPGSLPETVKQYLAIAALLLERNQQSADPAEAGLNYYASRLLLEKAKQGAPELVNSFQSGVTLNADRVADVYKKGTPGASNRTSPSNQKSTTEKSEDTDDSLLARFHDHWLQKDYANAQNVLESISSPSMREELSQVLSFRKLGDEIEGGHPLGKVKMSILGLPQGLESAILWCGLANGQLRQANLSRAREALIMAVNSSAQIKDHRRPYLTLSVAKIYSSFDRSMASLTFKEAIRQFNVLESKAPPTMAWQHRVDGTVLWREFPLRMKALATDISELIEELSKGEKGELYPNLLMIKDEEIKARSLISYLKLLFSEKTIKT